MKKINIKESLQKLDIDTDFKYNLTHLYESFDLDEDKKKELVQYLDGPTSAADIGKFLNTCGTNCATLSEMYPDDLEDGMSTSKWSMVRCKSVEDSDGFNTEYAWYKDSDGHHVMVFGDSDMYSPDEGNFDAEFDNEASAEEWFNNYKGFADEDIDEDLGALAVGALGSAAAGFGQAVGDKVASKFLGECDIQEALDDLDDFNLEYQHNDDEYSDDDLANVYGGDTDEARKSLIRDMEDKYLNESLNQDKLLAEISAKTRQFLTAELGYENDFVDDYVHIEVRPSDLTFDDRTTDSRVVLEVRAELSYEELSELGDVLNKIVTKYDREAYFEPESAGITQAYVRTDLGEEHINQSKVQPIIDALQNADTKGKFITTYVEKFIPIKDTLTSAELDLVYDLVDKLDAKFDESLTEDRQFDGHKDPEHPYGPTIISDGKETVADVVADINKQFDEDKKKRKSMKEDTSARQKYSELYKEIQKYVSDKLNDLFDNFVIAYVSENHNYDADWAPDDLQDSAIIEFSKAQSAFVRAAARFMLANYPLNESLTEDLGVGMAAPTGYPYTPEVEAIIKQLDKYKDEPEVVASIHSKLKYYKDKIDETIHETFEFDEYWDEHRDEILSECSNAAGLIESLDIDFDSLDEGILDTAVAGAQVLGSAAVQGIKTVANKFANSNIGKKVLNTTAGQAVKNAGKAVVDTAKQVGNDIKNNEKIQGLTQEFQKKVASTKNLGQFRDTVAHSNSEKEIKAVMQQLDQNTTLSDTDRKQVQDAINRQVNSLRSRKLVPSKMKAPYLNS